MISVLFPSRERVASLCESVASLTDFAAVPAGVEYLIAADPDDMATRGSMARVQEAAGEAAVTLWVCPERYGYGQLHLYYNLLAKLARGDWLFLWNDDATMKTPGWDRIIEAQEMPAVLWPRSSFDHHANNFPVWPKAWSDVMGHVSLNAHCDTWLEAVAEVLSRHVKVPIEIFHDRADRTGNHDDAVYREGREAAARTLGEFAGQQDQIKADVLAVMGLLGVQKFT